MTRPTQDERRHTIDTAVERLRELLAGAQDGWLFAQIAEQVADRRRALGLSQAELAEICGTTQSAIARLESGGRPPPNHTHQKHAHPRDCDHSLELRPRSSAEGTEAA